MNCDSVGAGCFLWLYLRGSKLNLETSKDEKAGSRNGFEHGSGETIFSCPSPLSAQGHNH